VGGTVVNTGVAVSGGTEVNDGDEEEEGVKHGPAISSPVQTGAVKDDVEFSVGVKGIVEPVPGRGPVAPGPPADNVPFVIGNKVAIGPLREGGEVVLKSLLRERTPLREAVSDEFAEKGLDVAADGTQVPERPVGEVPKDDSEPATPEELFDDDKTDVKIGLEAPAPAVDLPTFEPAEEDVGEGPGRDTPEPADTVPVKSPVPATNGTVVLGDLKIVDFEPVVRRTLPVKAALEVAFDENVAVDVVLTVLDEPPGLLVPGTEGLVVPTASARDVAELLPVVVDTSNPG